MYPREVDPDMKQPPAGAPDPMQHLAEFGAGLAAEDKQRQPAFQLPQGVGQIKITKSGMSFTDVDPRVFEGLMDSQKKLGEIMGSFHQTAEQLKGKEQNLQTPTGVITNAVSRLAGNLASQNDMPGWVKGLGQTARELNPTLEEVRGQRMGVEGQEALLAEHRARILETHARTHDANELRRADLERKAQEGKERAYGKKLEIADRIVKDSKGQVDATRLKAIGLDEDDVELFVSQAKGLAKAEGERLEARKNLMGELNKTRVEVAKIHAAAVRDSHVAKTSTPEARLRMRSTLENNITRIEASLAGQRSKINLNILTTPEERAAAIKEFTQTEIRLTSMKKLLTEMEQLPEIPAPGQSPVTTPAAPPPAVGGVRDFTTLNTGKK
jgi:hypothetical protein